MVSRTPENIHMQPSSLTHVMASCNTRQPMITLVIGSRVEKMAVVDGPAYRIPSWYKELPATATQIATRKENTHAFGVRDRVS